MKLRKPSTAFLVFLTAPIMAQADLTAQYAPPNSAVTVKIEVASNGDVRGNLYGEAAKRGGPFIIRDGHSYFLDSGPSGTAVIRAQDQSTLLNERLAKIDPAVREEMQKHIRALVFIEKGATTVNGRTGSAYFMKADPSTMVSPVPWAVMSTDPSLTPLGVAMTRQFETSMSNISTAYGPETFQNMLSVLKKGAPLSCQLLFGGALLQSVDFKKIPASEFELPAKPLTLDEARKRLTSEGKL